MNEPFPAIGSHFEEEQEISNSSQRKNDFFLDVSLSTHVEPVAERRSGHLSPERTKRYGMTDFSDLTVENSLLQEFDPLSSQNATGEDPSENTKPSVQRLDSREKMELHRASADAVSSSGDPTSSGFDTEPADDGTYNLNLNENNEASDRFEDKDDLNRAAARNGKAPLQGLE